MDVITVASSHVNVKASVLTPSAFRGGKRCPILHFLIVGRKTASCIHGGSSWLQPWKMKPPVSGSRPKPRIREAIARMDRTDGLITHLGGGLLHPDPQGGVETLLRYTGLCLRRLAPAAVYPSTVARKSVTGLATARLGRRGEWLTIRAPGKPAITSPPGLE